jgi:nucleotide-binding universal stress UspA family protein
MSNKQKILIAVDYSDATDRAIDYVGHLLCDRNNFDVHLLHVLKMPPQLMEWGGSEDPIFERQGSELQEREQHEWIHNAERAAQPIVDRAGEKLTACGVPEEMVHLHFVATTDREDVAATCLDYARRQHCDTVVVGRGSFPWYTDLFHHHTAPDLIRDGKGLAIWVVE